jgi:hypothetical protein
MTEVPHPRLLSPGWVIFARTTLKSPVRVTTSWAVPS